MASSTDTLRSDEIERAESWQQKRRVESRARFLEAAAETFATKGYDGTTVEDILSRAGIGRTSFYKHFEDKLAVAAALFEAFMPGLEDAYAQLAEQRTNGDRDVRSWLDGLIDRYAANRGAMKVFAEVMVREPGFAVTVSQIQRKIMRRLGARYRGFADAAASEDVVLRTPASMILNFVDSLCSDIALRDARLDRATAVAFVAGIVERFIDSGTDQNESSATPTSQIGL